MNRLPGQGRYAKVEREQRWLVRGLPAGVTNPRDIEDHYWTNTRLRLRRVASGGDVAYKLGQKVRVTVDDPEVVHVTNIYLSLEEYVQLLINSSTPVSKTRWSLAYDGVSYAIDYFTGRHAGLILAEVELDETAALLTTPSFAQRDVTHDDRYSGGRLATATDEDVRALIGS